MDGHAQRRLAGRRPPDVDRPGRQRHGEAEADAATAAAWLEQQTLAPSSDQAFLLPYLQARR
jgi:hypothetical protein